MRVTVSHNKGQAEAIRRVNEGIDQLFQSAGTAGVEIRDLERSWNGNTMSFSFTGKMGPFTAPIRGNVVVTDAELTIDVDLGIVGKFMPEDKIRRSIEGGAQKMLEA
jgi:hypothetical protein